MTSATRTVAGVLLAALALAPGSASGVVGGTKADQRAFPYLADLDVCGGALIAPDRVLTAAHCVTDVRVGERIRVGPLRATRRIVRIAQHPEATRHLEAGGDPDGILPFDAAIVELDRPLADVTPLRLATAAESALWRPGASGVTLGRGTTSLHGGGAGPLRVAEVQTRSDRFCQRAFARLGRGREYSAARTLCTTDPDRRRPHRSSCYGDSGNPLVVADGARRPVSIGIDAWGVACGERGGDPEAYVETAAIRDFALSERPIWRPRALDRPRLKGAARPNRTLTCEPPRFTGAPTRLRYRFDIDGDSPGEAGSPRYRVPRKATGAEVTCTVVAESPGGAELTRPAPIKVVRKGQ